MSGAKRDHRNLARRRILPQLAGTPIAVPNQRFKFFDRFGFMIAQRAFPDYENAPSCSDQKLDYMLVTSPVGFKLCTPEFLTSSRDSEVAACGMRVPKAAVNEHHSPPFWEDDIRMTRQVLCVQAETEARSPQRTAETSFWLGVLAADGRHHPGARHTVDNVRHDHRPSASRMLQL
jgi:hypothetical protein